MNTADPKKQRLLLAIGAIGVVFGDIGTSPLYALRESFSPIHGLEINAPNIIGVVSLLIWMITLIVCVKYLGFVLRADNKGEGGILALVSLVSRYVPKSKKGKTGMITLLGITGAALLYSDGMLTPAVSVLSAIEGLTILSPNLSAYIIPIALIVLVSLFPFQKKGTEKVGMIFGPILSLWFLVIGILGFFAILRQPLILQAFNPFFAASFLIRNGAHCLGVMGAVFLAMTGAEVLYSDLGHFGASPIRRSWFYLVYPALILNYMGQGAFLLSHPDQADNLFYRLAPDWAIIPLVILATVATIIASQAVITGAFSIARQSVQLGLLPRIHVRHTSSEKIGQVYVPLINWLLMFGTVALVLTFKTSSRLTQTYGITVSATMFITTLLMIYLANKTKAMKPWLLIPLGALFLVIEGLFCLANLTKTVTGGWIIVTIAAAIFLLMKTWVDGNALFRAKLQIFRLTPADFAGLIEKSSPARVQGTAIFLTADPQGLPKALLHNLKHNRVLHENTIILSVQTVDEPFVQSEYRLSSEMYPGGITHVVLHYGFSETPDVPAALLDLDLPGYDHDPMKTTYFLGREAIAVRPGKPGEMALWRKRLYLFLFRNAISPTDYFNLPAERVIDIGSKTDL
jgi:KUP system potassium uptake protein